MKDSVKIRILILDVAALVLLILFGFYPIRIRCETPVSNASTVRADVTVWKSVVLGTKTCGSFTLVRSNGTEEEYGAAAAMPHDSLSSSWYLTGLRYDAGINAYEFADCLIDKFSCALVFRDNKGLYYSTLNEVPESFIEFIKK